jgi:hypothetical protein
MNKETYVQRYTLSEIVDAYALLKPTSDLGKLVEIIGAEFTAKLVKDAPEKRFYIPKAKTLMKAFQFLTVRDELKNQNEGTEQFDKKVKELSKTFEISKGEVLKLYRGKI